MKTFFLFCTVFFLSAQMAFTQDNTLTGVLLDVNNKVIKNYPVTLGKASPVTVKTDKNGIFTFPDADLQETLYVGDKKGLNPIAIPVNGYSFVTIKSTKGNFNTEYLSEPDSRIVRYLQQIERDKKKNFNTMTADDIKLSGCRDIYCVLRSFGSVNVTTSSDGLSQINIVGINNSIRNSTSPLVVINGIPTAGGLEGLSVEEIEDVTVSKDGTMYGTRGANGVILIRLKK